MAWYTGKTFRGVDYNPTWPNWTQGPGGNDVNLRLQTFDSDMANDAFASLWGKGFQTSPAGNGPFSVPVQNTIYRDDLGKIASDGFNLVRLYNWDVARGTSPGNQNQGLDHVNFLNYAKSLGLTIVVPVSDFFLNNDQFSWNQKTPDATYSFGSATIDIQNDFKQFIASITDPSTGKIFSNVQISVGNEGDIGEGGIFQANNSPPNTNASDFLARTNWWIHNLHQAINGVGGVNGPSGAIVPITATFANADQGNNGVNGSWMNWVLAGVTAGQASPNGWKPFGQTFTSAVTGIAATDSDYANFYYNSFNIGQSDINPPYNQTGFANTLSLYDSAATPWPGSNVTNVPLLLMEVFTPNRNATKVITVNGVEQTVPVYPDPRDQALAAVQEAKALEQYLKDHHAGTPDSTTNLMGYNYFEFNDEPAANKFVGLYQYDTSSTNAHTGTSAIFYIGRGGFQDFVFPVYTLKPSMLPDGTTTLVSAWTATFAHVSIAPMAANLGEGALGVKPFTFAVTRTGDITEAASVGYSVVGSGIHPADAADFVGGILPSGVVDFAPGETIKTLTINVAGDATVEPDNDFAVSLFNPSAALALVGGSATGTILNEDGLKAHDDAYVILQGHSLTAGAAIGTLFNDENVPNGSAATLSATGHGQLQLGADGSVSYTPNAGFTGVDSFGYYAFGANGGSDVGHTSIYVVPLNVGATTTLDLLGLNAGQQIASTYAAFFGRAADSAGFEFWVDQLNHNLPTLGAKATFANIASSFAASAEAKALYPFLNNPVGASDAQINAFVDSVYNNMFNRSADAAGSAYWSAQVKQAGAAVGSVLINIISGAQDTAAGKDITTLMSKAAVSLDYVFQQELHGTVWAGASDVAAATALLHAVTSDAATLLTGIKNAEDLIANHA